METCVWVSVLHVDVFVVGRVGVRAADDDDEDEEEGQAQQDHQDGRQEAAAEAAKVVAGFHRHLAKKLQNISDLGSMLVSSCF